MTKLHKLCLPIKHVILLHWFQSSYRVIQIWFYAKYKIISGHVYQISELAWKPIQSIQHCNSGTNRARAKPLVAISSLYPTSYSLVILFWYDISNDCCVIPTWPYMGILKHTKQSFEKSPWIVLSVNKKLGIY